jgi:TetR/AcrR family fatty acid metabolism transcriptional regulator
MRVNPKGLRTDYLSALLEPLPLHYFYGIATAFRRLTHILRSKAPIVEKNGAAETSKRRVNVHSSKNNARHSDKYQRILDAAILVIAEHGYFQSRVSEIAERAGVADGTIYLYFKNKEEILRAAITSAFTEFLRRARHELEQTGDPVEQLHRLARLHLAALSANKPLAAVFQTELRHSAKFLAEFSRTELKQYFDLIREIVRRGQQSGTFRAGISDKIVANCFFGALDEMVTSWVLSDHDYPLEGAAVAVADVIIAGLKA